jgi:FtsP/CotA-like multicopper oxidase with cupredoxin domain
MRRGLLASAALAAVLIAVPASPAGAWGGYDGGTTVTPFTQPLKVPPVLSPSRSDATTDYYNVDIQSGTANVIPGKSTPVWTYNGSFPGPTIVTNTGRQTSLHVTNRLAEAMSLHLHGGHQASVMDGLPNDLVAFGASKDYVYPNSVSARTLWYHDHARDVTARHVWNGLAGMYIVHDSQEQALNLPSGNYDIPLMFLNRAFNSDGSMPYQDGSGDELLVNGVPQPYFKVEARKYRFRMLNASNDDFYNFSLSNSQAMVQVANEGGLLPAPVSRTTVSLAPAERADVVIDFSKVAHRHEHGPGDAAPAAEAVDDRRGAADVHAGSRRLEQRRQLGHQRPWLRPERVRRHAEAQQHGGLDVQERQR